MSYSLKIGHLFPDILNMYGDKGNIAALKSRITWRGWESDVVEIMSDSDVNFDDFDILLLGGGSEKDDCLACEILKAKKEELSTYIEKGGVVLALCGGFTILGKSFMIKDEKIDGLSILDIESEYDERFIGNIILETEITGEKLKVVGFENHAARTNINGHIPFGKVLCGEGNNGKDKTSGVIYKNLLGTYLHGPLLPKNPVLCDYIIAKAIEQKYGEKLKMPPLCDTLENEAHDYCVKRFIENE